MIRANGEVASNGWLTSANVEAEIASWYDAKTLDEEKAAPRRLNRAAFDHVVYAPLGTLLRHKAYRKNVSGVIQGPLPFFWGVSINGMKPATMLTYIIRRILAAIPVMAVVALFAFSLLYIAPGDPAAVIAGDQTTPEDVARIRASLGFAAAPLRMARPRTIALSEFQEALTRGPHIAAVMFSKYPVNKQPNERSVPKSCVG